MSGMLGRNQAVGLDSGGWDTHVWDTEPTTPITPWLKRSATSPTLTAAFFALGVRQKTAWFMLHRIRRAVQTGTFAKMSGGVEADETFSGGAARFMHKDRKAARLRARRGGMVGKIAVMGLLERHGPDKHSRVRTVVVPTIRKRPPRSKCGTTSRRGSEVITEALQSYAGLVSGYTHKVIDHAESYVKGHVSYQRARKLLGDS